MVYIVGSGRSGSTVLDTVLGNHGQVESVGELIGAQRAFDSQVEFCACGQLAGECDFWRAVRDEWRATRPEITTAADWRTLQGRFERPRQILRAYTLRFHRSRAYREYADTIQALYAAIATVSGASVVVDSSKNPVRAMALAHARGIDLSLIHLVRDGRGVAWSKQKALTKAPKKGVQHDWKPKPIWWTAIRWRVANALSRAALRRVPAERRMTLRYEDFVNAPQEALERIGRISGMDYSEVAQALQHGQAMTVGHTIAGSRVRMSGTIRLRENTEWRTQMPRRQKRLFWLIAGSAAKRYAYRKGG